MNRQEKLNIIANNLQFQLDLNENELIREDIEPTDDYLIRDIQITRGVLKEWLKVLKNEGEYDES